MPPEMNHSQSSAPYSLELLADVDILAKSVDDDFVPVSDVVLFKSFDVPSGVSLDGLSKGTLVHQLVSDVSSRPSDNWWLTALDVIHKHVPHESEPAACAAEIYLARVAQSHIEAGHAQLDYIEGRDSGMEFMDSPEHTEMELLAVVKQNGATVPQSTVDSLVAEIEVLPDVSTSEPPEDAHSAGGPVTNSETGGPVMIGGDQPTVVLTPDETIEGAQSASPPAHFGQKEQSVPKYAPSTGGVSKQNDGEEIQHDNVMGSAMGGLGLAGDGEISATIVEEDKAKKGLLSDIELIRQKIDEADRLRDLLEKVEALTGEQNAIERIESHVHPSSHAITVGHDDLEMKAGGT